MIYSFERLEVWQEARKLTAYIYTITSLFPRHEKFGLTSQLRRCSVSICSNIAEGSGRSGFNDQAKFYNIAYASTLELLNQLLISLDIGLISEDTLSKSREQIEKISRMLNALRRHTQTRKA